MQLPVFIGICAYFVKLQNASELDADIVVFTPVSLDACLVELSFTFQIFLYTTYENICCQYM